MHLNLWQQAFLDLSLDPSKHERSDDFMKLFDDIIILSGLFFFTKIHAARVSQVKPFIEIIRGGEDLRQQEVQETPELMKVVLEGCTCQ